MTRPNMCITVSLTSNTKPCNSVCEAQTLISDCCLEEQTIWRQCTTGAPVGSHALLTSSPSLIIVLSPLRLIPPSLTSLEPLITGTTRKLAIIGGGIGFGASARQPWSAGIYSDQLPMVLSSPNMLCPFIRASTMSTGSQQPVPWFICCPTHSQ